MMKQRILPWMGLIILFLLFGISQETLAQKPSTSQVSYYENEDSVPNNDSLGTVPLVDVGKDITTSAELIGKWQSPDERRLFIKVAMAFLGAPYRWGGVNLRGIDCSAFVQKIYELFGISLPRTAYEQAHMGVHVAKNKLSVGDLVFFNTKRPLGHVGIYIGDSKFVHASSVGSRVVKIDGLDEPYYNKHFATARRLKGLDGEVL
jgi:peptidoglycan endopeptidase LytE